MFFCMSLDVVFADAARKSTKAQAAELIEAAVMTALGTTPPTTSEAKLRRQLAETTKVKRKCCHSKPRCKKCPTVMHRLAKQNALQLDDAALKAALLKSRMW